MAILAFDTPFPAIVAAAVWVGVGLSRDQLPLLWDCDFIPGAVAASVQPERYVLCEVNVSSLSPFPPWCIEVLVAAVTRRLRA